MIKVVLVFGGDSLEHEVSIESAISMAENINKQKYLLSAVYITRSDQYIKLSDIQNKGMIIDLVNKYNHDIPNKAETSITSYITYLKSFDVIFSLLHGNKGENGTMQGLFEMIDIPYVGSGVQSSSITINKELTRHLLSIYHIKTVPFISVDYQFFRKNKLKVINDIIKRFVYPIFVKPSNLGSSIGVYKVFNLVELSQSIDKAFLLSNKIILEEAIIGHELSVAIIESTSSNRSDGLIVSVPGEVECPGIFYDYKMKYINKNLVKFNIPARLPNNYITEISNISRRIFYLLGCRSMARIDFFLEKNTREVLFSEINTIPGFTSTSLYQQLLAASDIDFGTLFDKMIKNTLSCHNKK